MRAPVDTTHHEETLLSLVDPFSPSAANAKYPDQGSGRSLTFQQRYTQTFTSTAGGFQSFSVNVKPNFPYLFQNGIAGTTVTWAATYTDDQSSNLLNTYGQTYRPTSAGIRILNLLSATTSSGYVVLAKGGPPVLAGTTQMNANNFSNWDSHSNSHGAEYHATLHPLTADAYDFAPVADYAPNNKQDNTWENFYFYAAGLPASTNCFFVELYINYEYTPKEDAPIAQLATAQPVMDTQMMTAINRVQSNLPDSHRSTQAVVRSTIKREAKKAIVKHVLPFVAKKAAAFLA